MYSLYLIIVVLGVFFNPASSTPAHQSCSVLRSPDAPAGSAQRPPALRGENWRGSVWGMGKARPVCRALVGGVWFSVSGWTKWCAPRQVDSEIIYILRMKILPAYHMVLGAMQPVDGHGLP